MLKLNGKYNTAKVFTDNVDNETISQVIELLNQDYIKDAKIRIMPDCHAGAGCVIGTTMTISDKVCPNLVGVDIGCGMLAVRVAEKEVDLPKLDDVINTYIPAGFNVNDKPLGKFSHLSDLVAPADISLAYRSIGSLGGGNHFIELDRDDDGSMYVAVHSGSRHLGKEVTEYYLKCGQRELKEQGVEVPYELTWLTGKLKEDYLHDLQVVQEYAELNRQVILEELAKGMKWKMQESVSVCHNYIDKEGILRKGAISAREGEKVVIPINMRDGILLGIGKGNPDWNYSAPHGSGRILKRSEVKNQYTVSSFKKEMKGIYCSCIGKETLDEAPFAYRNMEMIKEAVEDTVDITQVLHPVYNFKAGNDN